MYPTLESSLLNTEFCRSYSNFEHINFQLLQELKPNDKHLHKDFADAMLDNISGDNLYLKRISFTDEASFHNPGIVKKMILGMNSRRPNLVCEKLRDSPKVKV